MSATVSIGSSAEFGKILSTSNIVITDFYADWCGPCKTISPVFESLSTKYSKPNRITFTKVNVDSQQAIAQQYSVRAMPTFLIFRSGAVINTIQGADSRGLTTAIENAVKLAGPAKPTFSSQGRTLGGTAPRGTSLSRPFNWQSYVDPVLAFIALYLTTLFTLDAHKAGDESPFNINRSAREGGSTIGRGTGPALGTKRSGAAVAVGKRLGTIADISGGD